MRSSILKKVNRDVLIEWIYDTNNSITESYKIMTDSRNQTKSYIGGDVSLSNNDITNQLIGIDPVQGKFAKVSLDQFNFLSLNDYTDGGIQHDILKIYLPSNFEFGEHQGVYFRIYTYDYSNKKVFEISNFFFDNNDYSKSSLLSPFTPPILYQEKVWDKFIELNIPSVNSISLQRVDGLAEEGTINYNLSGVNGISQTAPIFIDFQFISKITQIGSVKTYITSQKITTQFPQIPQLESLKLFIEESSDGDYFEIYPKYDGSFENFIEFMENSKNVNKFYYVEYTITLFEENIKGRPTKMTVRDDFSSKVEWRPIIKYSTTKSTIDVEMKLVNETDGTIEVKKSAYGLKPDQLSKYLINSKRIIPRDLFKPKIYSKNSFNPYGIDKLGKRAQPENKVQVHVPSLINIINISAFSESAINKVSQNKIENYHYIGKMKIGLQPFDNIFRFHLSFKDKNTLDPIDLTNCHDIKLMFRNDTQSIEFSQYIDQNLAPKIGVCQFRVSGSKFLDIKSLLKSGESLFYIVTTNEGITNILYTGLFDTLDNSYDLDEVSNIPGEKPRIIDDPNPIDKQETAIVTRRKVSSLKKSGEVSKLKGRS